jgi:TusE/DsrC/DsvC family sulfur relay protein
MYSKTIMPLDVNGTIYEVDEDGYLENVEDWTVELAKAMAVKDGTDLTEDHWEVIRFLRGYYEEFQIAPAVRVLTKAIGKRMGREKGNSKYLYELFPFGPAKQACKYAGLPRPTGCV